MHSELRIWYEILDTDGMTRATVTNPTVDGGGQSQFDTEEAAQLGKATLIAGRKKTFLRDADGPGERLVARFFEWLWRPHWKVVKVTQNVAILDPGDDFYD